MSREDVEIVRRVYDAVARRDAAEVFACYDPDIELDTTRASIGGLMEPRVYRGHDGIRQWFSEWNEAWEELETHCDELIDLGTHVVSSARYRARGRTSGVVVEGPVQYGVWTVRDRRPSRVVLHARRGARAREVGSWPLDGPGGPDRGRRRRLFLM